MTWGHWSTGTSRVRGRSSGSSSGTQSVRRPTQPRPTGRPSPWADRGVLSTPDSTPTPAGAWVQAESRRSSPRCAGDEGSERSDVCSKSQVQRNTLESVQCDEERRSRRTRLSVIDITNRIFIRGHLQSLKEKERCCTTPGSVRGGSRGGRTCSQGDLRPDRPPTVPTPDGRLRS